MLRNTILLLFIATLSFQPKAQNTFTPELLWQLGRVSGASISPDGNNVLYGITTYDLATNRGNRDLYVVPVAGGTPVRLTNTPGSEHGEQWRPDGKKIGFLAASDGEMQWWEMNPDGSGLQILTEIEGGISNVSYAPDMKHLAFTRMVKTGETVLDLYPDLPAANARIIDNLMFRHWDTWDDHHSSHLFIAPYTDGKVGAAIDLMEGEPYDTPLMPFGGSEQIAWSPDGNAIAYTSKKLTGRAYAESTNSDIYLYDLTTRATTNLTEGMPGYDMEPVWSPTGRYMVWNSMERPGFEADRNRIFVYDRETRQKREVTAGLGRDANHPLWATDEAGLYFLSGEQATYQLYYIPLAGGEAREITSGRHNYTHFAVADNNTLVAGRMDMNNPVELYRVTTRNGEARALTTVNKAMLSAIPEPRVEERWVTTTDGKQMLVWVIYPPDFDPAKKYPTLLYLQGGPQSAVSQFFSYRWNFRLMAQQGYIVVTPNRRGLPTFGRDWNDDISRDWGGQAMKDYLSAIDALAKEPFVDENRLGAVGASYGGYSAYWLAGNHEKRFKTFIAHCGLFNLESWYLTTEELFFANWDVGGPPWKPELQSDYAKFSPHRFAHKWDTPILVIHSEKDFRVPIGEGLQAFQAAQIQDIPSRFLYFPEEGHWVLSPQNGILWHREFFRWLDQWLKE